MMEAISQQVQVERDQCAAALFAVLQIIDNAGTTTGELAEQRQEIRDIIRQAIGHDD
jgi:hypothetical protein